MLNRFIHLAILCGLFCFSTNSHAQLFDLEVISYGGAEADTTLRAFIDSELAKVETEINKGLPSTSPDRMMDGMANSSVMAGKGIGTDYASNMDVLLIGAGIGVGADLTKDEATGGELSGVGVAPGLIVGMNLGWMDSSRLLGMDTNRLNWYVNYMGYTYKHTLEDKPSKKSDVELAMTAFGTHFRYDWIKGNDSKLFGWGGVKFTFGYEYNKTNITFNSTINETVNSQSGTVSTVTGSVTGAPQAIIETQTHSFPLALSTDVQFLYFLSLYGGLGADYSIGKAKGKGSLNGNDSTLSCSAGTACTATGNPNIIVRPKANIDGTGSALPFLFRGFLGVQFNLPFTRIFVQADKAFGNNLIGATAGLRFVY